jgi:1,2-diacylglycerol 3-alpha-glucosyltransferase
MNTTHTKKNILLLNSILYTAQNGVVPQVESIKDTMIYNLALGFKELGHRVTLVSASEYKPINEENYDVNVIFIKSRLKKIFPPSVLPFQPELWQFLKKNKQKFDLIESGSVFAFPSLFAAIICPRKTVVWHELALHQKKMKSIPSYFWYNVVAKLFFRKILIVARSEKAKGFISKYLHHVANEIVEHGVNLHKFQLAAEKKKQFIIVSQLIPRKNVGSIIDKFSRFAINEYADFKLIIVGKGELENQLRDQVKRQHIDKKVIFAGFKSHSELSGLLAESMAMLVDTKADLNMVSVPESIVAGTPVVTNLVPYSSLIVSEHHLGIAKDWNENDLKYIVENNDFYVRNCIGYRNQLTTVHAAEKIIEIYKKCKNYEKK